MDPFAILAATGLLPGLAFGSAPSLNLLDDGVVVIETEVGAGATANPGNRATCEIVVAQPAGKELLDTHKRGLPLTFMVGGETEKLLSEAAIGMRVGGVRLAVVPTGLSPSGILPARTGLWVWMRLTGLERP